MPTYKEQFDKLTRAYINGEVRPTNSCACFIGNLLNNTWEWSKKRQLNYNLTPFLWKPINASDLDPEYSFYTMQEICDMENEFMNPHGEVRDWEGSLFLAFESTLELLKQIHIAHGEAIDETPVFTKRQTTTTCA